MEEGNWENEVNGFTGRVKVECADVDEWMTFNTVNGSGII